FVQACLWFARSDRSLFSGWKREPCAGEKSPWRSLHLPPHHPKGKAHQEIERDSAVRKLQCGLDTGLNHCQNEKEEQPENEPVNAIVRFDSPPDGVDETSCH